MADRQQIQLAQSSPAAGSPSANAAAAADEARMCPSLYLAVSRGRTEEVMALLLQQHAVAPNTAGFIQHGQCNILEVSAGKNTVLHVAAEEGRDDLIREICLRFKEEGLLSSRNSTMDTPLHCAARAGHDTTVSLLVRLIQDCGEESIVGCENEAGDTPLHLAASHGHAMAVEALVSGSAAPAAVLNKAGMSPLYLAVMSGSVPSVGAIVTTCKDVSSLGPGSQNALHAAVFRSIEMVELLLTWKPDLAAQDDDSGSSPLHFASSGGDSPIVRAILDVAPPSTVYKKDSSNVSALHVAALMGHGSVVHQLLEACPDAAELRDGDGRTFLHTAAKENRPSVVSSAIANPMLHRLLDAQDGDGNTPLHLAVAAGATDVVEALLRKGKVRADVLNKDGHMPFDLAEESTGFFTMVTLVVTLLAYGARSRPQRQDNVKPWSGHEHIVKGVETTSDSLAVVAVLIATVAFAAGFNVPGGYGDNGMANLEKNHSFKFFLVLDTVAMTASVVAVILLVYGKASRSAGSWKSFVLALHLIWVSLLCLILAFYAALSAVMRTKTLYIVFVCIYLCTNLLVLRVTMWIQTTKLRTIWRFLLRSRSHAITQQDRAIKRQYPLAGAWVFNMLLFLAINNILLTGLGFFFSPDFSSMAKMAPTPSPIIS